MTFQWGKSTRNAGQRGAVQFTRNSRVTAWDASVLRRLLGDGASFGRRGLSLLIGGRWVVGSALDLALTLFVLFLLARDLALALLK